MPILNERLGKIFGIGKKQNRLQKKRRLQLETLEERQMLAVTVHEYEFMDESDFYDTIEPAPDFEDFLPPEDFEPVLAFEEVETTVIDEVYGELSYEQLYQLHQNIALRGQIAHNGVYGPLTQSAYYSDYLGVQTLGGPSNAPQNSPSGGTSEYVNIYIVDTLDDVVNANDGVLSLREAVALANGASGHDLIMFAEGLQGTITLGGTQLAITNSVDIIASGQITISGNDLSRIFYSATSNRTITLEGLILTNGYTTGSGGAIQFSYVDATLRDVVIKDSVAATSGGGVYASYTTNLAIENSLITGNSASETSGYGGGFYVIYCSGDVAITDSVIENNIARYGGGIALHTNVQNTITGTIIRENTAGTGGGIYGVRTTSATHLAKTNDITITDSQITGNTSINSAGGGIFHYSENISIEDSVISGNVSGSHAGGLYLYSTGESIVTGCVIEGNSATTYGGGIVSNRVTSGIFFDLPNDITITDTSITGNTAGTYSGGAVFHYSENVTLTDSLISGNTAGSYTGGLYLYSTGESIVTGCTIEGNRAVTSWGGGVGASRTTTTTSVFYNLSNEVTIADTTIANNEAATHGGGIYVTNSSTVTLDSSLLADNIARNKGGGLYATGTGSVNLVNSTVSGNKAETASGQTSTNEGGGIYVGTFAIPLSITNSTITNNTAYLGGGIRTATGTSPYRMNNTIVAGNTVSANSRGHDIYGAFLATSKNNLIGINTGLAGPTNGTNGNLVGTVAVPLDAKLSPLRDNGGPTWTHALLPGSLAIDAGDDNIVVNMISYDQRGLNRIFGTSVDIGACEYSAILRLTVDDGNATVVASGVTEVSFATGEYGEQQSLGFWITNEDDTNELVVDLINADLPDGVSFYTLSFGRIAPGESEYFEIRWNARETDWTGEMTIPTNDLENPLFVIKLAGTVTAITNPPVLANVARASNATYNPCVSGEVSGNFAGGYAKIEFDHDNDGVADGYANVWVSGNSFVYDPTHDVNFPVSGATAQNVSLKYRLVHCDFLGETLSSGAWSTISYSLQGTSPTGTLTVSSLTASGTKISGMISAAGDYEVEIILNDNASTRIRIPVGADRKFSVDLPLEYGVANAIKARVIAYSATEKMNLAGTWKTLSTTPVVPAVSTFTIKTSGNGGSVDGIVQGQLSNTAGNAAYTKVEIYNGTTVYGTGWTDSEGKFEIQLYDLPSTITTTAMTFTARAVKMKSDGVTPVYGTTRNLSLKYVPQTTITITSGNITLDSPKEGAANTTRDPSLTARTSALSGTDVLFEYAYSIGSASNWSAGEKVQGYAVESENATRDYYEGSYRISGLHNIATNTVNVYVRVRTAVWDAVLGDYIYGSWTQYYSSSPYAQYFTYEKPQDAPVVINSLTLVSGTTTSTTDPAIKGQVSNDGATAGLTVEVYQGTTLLGTTVTSEDGSFYYRPEGLSSGSVTLSVKVKEWNVITQQVQSSSTSSITFNLVTRTVPAAVVDSLALGDITGSGSTTANTYMIGLLQDDGEILSGTLIEFDHDGDGQTDGYTFSESDGTFRYTPSLTAGSYTIRARAARWNVSTSSWVVGNWTSLSVTVVNPAANWTPTVANISTAFGENNVSTDPAVKGQLTSQGGFENLVIQYDLGGNGTVDHENTPDAWGRFAWRPEIDLGNNTSQNVTIKVRAGKVVNGVTTWGAWTTYNYTYEKPVTTPASLISSNWSVGNSNNAQLNAKMISGTITPGDEALSVVVELDYTGDEHVDGIAVPGTDGEFTFYVTPGKTTVRARVVETLLVNGETVRREGAWQTKTYSGTLAPSTVTPELILEADSNGNFTGLKIEGYTSGMTVAIDLDNDGVAELSVTPVNERVTESAIFNSLESYYRDYPVDNPVTLPGGLNQPAAWVVKSNVQQTEKIATPVVVTTGLSTFEIAAHRQLQSDYVAAYLDAQEAIRQMEEASQSDRYAVETQSHHEQTHETSEQDSAVVSGFSQMELDLLNALPQIPSFSTVFEMPDFENDITFIELVESQENAYREYLIAEKESTYLNSLNDSLAISEAVARLTAECRRLVAEKQMVLDALENSTFENSRERAEIVAFYQAKQTETINQFNQLINATNDADEKAILQYQLELALYQIKLDEIDALSRVRIRYYEKITLEVIQIKTEMNDIEQDYADRINDILYPDEPENPDSPGQLENPLPDPSEQYDALLAAIAAWRNSSGVSTLWADYVEELVEHAKERYERERDAYELNYERILAAEEQLTDTIMQAWREAQDEADAAAQTAINDSLDAELLFRQEVQTAKAKYEAALEKNLLEYQNMITMLCNSYIAERKDLAVNQWREPFEALEIEYRDKSNEVSSLYKSGSITYQEYVRRLRELSDALMIGAYELYSSLHFSPPEIDRSFYTARDSLDLSYQNRKAAIEETYQHELIDAIEKYLCTSVDIGADYSVDLLNIAEVYENATVDASDDYNATVKSVDEDLQEELLDAGHTQNTDDLESEESLLAGLWNSYASMFDSWLSGQSNTAFSNYASATFDAEETYFQSLLGSAVDYVSSVFDKSKAEADTSINTLAGLAGTVADGISGFLTSWIGTSYGGEESYVDADRELSKANISAAAAYLKIEATIDKNTAVAKNELAHEIRRDSIDIAVKSSRIMADTFYYEVIIPAMESGDYSVAFDYILTENGPQYLSSYVSTQSAAESRYAGAVGYIPSTYSTIATQAINDEADYAKAVAYETYIKMVWQNEADYLTTCYATASNLLDTWYNGLGDLNETVGQGTLDANDTLRDAARNADPTSDMADYIQNVAQADVTYTVALAQNLGVYQLALRSPSAPGASYLPVAYQAETARIGSTSNARVAYFQALGNAGLDYTDDVLDALLDYNDEAWDASDDYASTLDNAGKSYGDTLLALEESYSSTMFAAEKALTLATFNAYRSESEGNAKVDKQAAKLIADASRDMADAARDVIDDLLEAILSAPYQALNTVWTTANTELNAITAYPNARQLAAESASALVSSTKSNNATARENKVNAAEKIYDNTSVTASTVYSVGAFNAWTNYLTTATNAGVSYDTAMKAAEDAFTNSIITATEEYDKDYCRITGLYQDAINIINGGGTILPGHFDGAGSMDVEVCFVAGTPILLANGSSKPIEEMEVGDQVLARPHDDPQGELVKCRVRRVFHNAPQSTYELKFDNGLEIRATKEHPFYVPGSGWVQTLNLEPGAVCVSAESEPVKLLSKRFIAEKVPVYNFEVDQAHTYHVGTSTKTSVLVHNSCWDYMSYGWGVTVGFGKGLAQGAANIVNGVQDIGVSVINLTPAAINGIAQAEEYLGILNTDDPLRVPYLKSPDWSRGLITDEYGEPGSWSDTHGWSKFIGGQSAVSLGTLGAGQLISKSGVGQNLGHVTSPGSATGIAESGVINGRCGVFALSNPPNNIHLQTIRTLGAHRGAVVPISDVAAAQFHSVPVSGPLFGIIRMNGGYLAPYGSVNLATGATTPVANLGSMYSHYIFDATVLSYGTSFGMQWVTGGEVPGSKWRDGGQ